MERGVWRVLCVSVCCFQLQAVWENSPPSPKNLADKRASLTGIAAASPPQQNKHQHIRTVCPGDLGSGVSLVSVSLRTSISLQALSCLSSSSTAYSDWGTKASRQAPLWWGLREKFIRNSAQVGQNGKNGLFLGIYCGMYVFPLLSYVCICVYVCLREKKHVAGTEKWVEVCGKPWCRPVFVWLGLCSRGCFSRAPDNVRLKFANILSSYSGDMLKWERLARAAWARMSYQLCARGCLECVADWVCVYGHRCSIWRDQSVPLLPEWQRKFQL